MLEDLRKLIDESNLDLYYKALIKRCMETAYMAGQRNVLMRLTIIEQEIYSEIKKDAENREPNPFKEVLQTD